MRNLLINFKGEKGEKYIKENYKKKTHSKSK